METESSGVREHVHLPMQIVVPIAGASPFFPPDEYPFPKPLIEVRGVMMIERVIENLMNVSPTADFIFVARQQDVARFSLDSTLKLLCPPARVIALKNPTRGALCSCLLAIDLLKHDAPLIISNGDQIIEDDLARIVSDFRSADAAAGVITFRSTHPRWSYARVVNGRVLEAVEKRVISNQAIAGFYYFSTAATFIKAAMQTITAGNAIGEDYYIAPSLNEVILANGDVRAIEIPADRYSSFYSPAKVHEFEQRPVLDAESKRSGGDLADVRLLIPAAGEGSRFRKAGYGKAKPFLDVLGRPMIQAVVENARPSEASVTLLLRGEHIREEAATATELLKLGYRIVPVDELTEGTACTLLLARSVFDDGRPLLVANSDQLVDFSVDDFVQDCFNRRLDGSILVFRNEPPDPKWSFARVDENGLVLEVAEKRPISNLATVGIYLFRRGADFVSAAIDMIAQNDRVNNEFYTCPVYNYMIRQGARIGVFEVPSDAMHGLGTPEDLTAYLERTGQMKMA